MYTRHPWGLVRAPLRRCCVMALLFAQVGFIAGIPVSSPANSDVQSAESYPCQGQACGCPSARHCWLSCRCKSLPEKLAWAKARGVRPPDYVQAPLAMLSATAVAARPIKERLPDPAMGPSHRVACEHCSRRVPVQAQVVPAVPDEDSSLLALRRQNETGRRWVLGIQAQKCQGQFLYWLAMTLVALPMQPSEFLADSADAGLRIELPQAASYFYDGEAPEPPPPRRTA